MGNFNLGAIFLTGLFAGSFTCLAVQGGLLAATIAQQTERRLKQKVATGQFVPILSFLLSKLVAYMILGALLGYIGSLLVVSAEVSIVLDILVAVFMLGTALHLLHVHPFFRYFVIEPPRFVNRLVRHEAKRGDVFAPAVLGLLTVVIPCGTTQAIMALAVASGNVVTGALLLGAFTLGTSPFFFLLGFFVTRLGSVLKQSFLRLGAYAIILFALINLNAALTLADSPVTFNSIVTSLRCTISFCAKVQYIPVSMQTIFINQAGYSPTNFSVRAGAPVTIRLKNSNATGCQQAFTIASLNLRRLVTPGETKELSFIAPKTPQDITFSCSAGYHPGVIHVVRG